jgi:NlpC/P60 family putative phage cell wall peptidase
MNARTDLLLAEARTWLGTPWRHQGRTKGVAVDCVGFVIEVARAVGVLSVDEAANYRRRPDGVTLPAKLGEYLERKPISALAPGDVVMIRTDAVADHVALVGDYPLGGLTLLHAYLPARKVVEHRLDPAWRRRIVGAFALPETA